MCCFLWTQIGSKQEGKPKPFVRGRNPFASEPAPAFCLRFRENGDAFFHANSEMRRYLNGNLHSDADSMAREAYLRVCYEIAAFPDRYASTPRQ